MGATVKPNQLFLGTVLAILIVVPPMGCQDKQDITVPGHLIGVWETSSPRYKGRYLKFTEHSIVFGTGAGCQESHLIRKIESSGSNGDKMQYTFYYKDSEGEKWTQTLTYGPGSGGTIQLKNRDEIWKKSKQTEP